MRSSLNIEADSKLRSGTFVQKLYLLFVRSVGNTGSSFAHFNAVIPARVRPNETGQTYCV